MKSTHLSVEAKQIIKLLFLVLFFFCGMSGSAFADSLNSGPTLDGFAGISLEVSYNDFGEYEGVSLFNNGRLLFVADQAEVHPSTTGISDLVVFNEAGDFAVLTPEENMDSFYLCIPLKLEGIKYCLLGYCRHYGYCK